MKVLYTFLTIFTFSILILSCGNGSDKSSKTEDATTQTENATDVGTGEETGTKISLIKDGDNADISNAYELETVGQPAGKTPSSTITQTTPPGMNPPHGQPGHDCAIPVGQPLNSAPKAAQTQPNLNVPSGPRINMTPPTAPQQSTTTTTAPGMNPPHGQPGHDCAIPVGAPLNSKK